MTKRYLIGIDTGGTYTDAVIVDAQAQSVVASAKSLTTHGELARGVSSALSAVLSSAENVNAADIGQVSLSTTLATNALVEGRGSSIAVVLIGFDEAMIERTTLRESIPDATLISLGGGHRHDGTERMPLDESGLARFCTEQPVDAFAVASHYAVRNPAHERRAAELIHSLTGKPVSASHDLSDSLNGPLRALTAALNARIISLIVNLVDAVAQSMSELGVDAPIMIVKGDGSIATSDDVIAKPIETILSGPAASVIGARFLTRLSDFVVADMGGTTSDVATVINGWPRLSDRGANVGGHRTLVKAIDMQTIGLGGDSGVDLDDSHAIELATTRRLPMAMLTHQFPEIEQELEAALGASSGMRSALDYVVLNTQSGDGRTAQMSEREQRFVQALHPDRPTRVGKVVNGAADRSCLRSLTDRGLLRRSGFTPSDAAHVIGAQGQWSTRGARLAAELLGRSGYRVSGTDVETQVRKFCEEVIEVVVDKSTRLIIRELSGVSTSTAQPWVDVVASGANELRHLNVRFDAQLPIVAVGGPAQVFYRTVGQRVNTEAVVPEHSAVANAVGAAVGLVRAEVVVEITLQEKGGFLIHAGTDPLPEADATRALELGEQLAREQAEQGVRERGGHPGQVFVDIARIQIPDVEDDSGLVGATVTASCDSVPHH